jgi:hypothetical protein
MADFQVFHVPVGMLLGRGDKGHGLVGRVVICAFMFDEIQLRLLETFLKAH